MNRVISLAGLRAKSRSRWICLRSTPPLTEDQNAYGEFRGAERDPITKRRRIATEPIQETSDMQILIRDSQQGTLTVSSLALALSAMQGSTAVRRWETWYREL